MNRRLEIKSRLSRAFALMRRDGFVARQNFLCCRNCAGTRIAYDLRAYSAEKRATCKGAVFYTRQDAEGLAPRDRFWRGSGREEFSLHIAFGQVDFAAKDDGAMIAVGVNAVIIGRALVEQLGRCGLRTNWNGSEETCVEVVGLAEDVQ